VLDRLAAICRTRGLADLGTRLGELGSLVGDDMAALERDLAVVCDEEVEIDGPPMTVSESQSGPAGEVEATDLAKLLQG
jgi:hypothetical protein